MPLCLGCPGLTSRSPPLHATAIIPAAKFGVLFAIRTNFKIFLQKHGQWLNGRVVKIWSAAWLSG